MHNYTLPDDYAARGWSLHHDELGWHWAEHPMHGRTGQSFPTPDRGLKFLLMRIDGIEETANPLLGQIAALTLALDAEGQHALYRHALLLAGRYDELEASMGEDAGEEKEQGGGKANGKVQAKGRGYLETKTIKGRQYIYRRWREGGQLKSEYVGRLKA